MVEPGEPGVLLPNRWKRLASLILFPTFFSLVIHIKESLSLVTQLIHSWSASGIVVVW